MHAYRNKYKPSVKAERVDPDFHDMATVNKLKTHVIHLLPAHILLQGEEKCEWHFFSPRGEDTKSWIQHNPAPAWPNFVICTKCLLLFYDVSEKLS